VETIRRADAGAAQSRVERMQSAERADLLQCLNDSLSAAMREKETLVESLERDLFNAHQLLHSSSAGRMNYTNTNTTMNANTNANENTLKPGLDDLESLLTSPEEVLLELDADSTDIGGGDANARILQAVQGQRDRFIRTAREREGELGAVRARLERAEDEVEASRNENLELYRRLRVLRAAREWDSNSSNSNSISMGSSIGSAQGLIPSMRSRRQTDEGIGIGMGGVEGGRGDNESDELDAKYESIYERDISPFRIEALDKHAVLSRLNVFERGLIYVNRFVLQDRWARHALLGYLVFVHLLALVYVWKVLNPDMVGEIDAHLKAKWSAETLGMHEHPDA
jgi:hypothetical protein